MKNFCITFAGAVGSSKSPIATHLSINLNLPVFNNDNIRTEVLEDLDRFDEQEYISRRNQRALSLVQTGNSFIYDASIDREWEFLFNALKEANYSWFVISLDLSKDFLINLYKLKNYLESLNRIDSLMEDHQKFLNSYGNLVNLHLYDEDFPYRLEKSYQAVREYLEKSVK